MTGKARHDRFVVALMALLLFGGGALITALIYFYLNGELERVCLRLAEFLARGGYMSALLLSWVLIVPGLMLALLFVNLARRRKLKAFEFTWRDAVRLAAERETADRAAEEDKIKFPPPRFCLSDRTERGPVEGSFDGVDSLPELCEKFQLFAAGRGLFYDISKIREFVSGLAVSKLVLLQGVSGTGKTSLAYTFGEFLGNPSTVIPVQPMWKERTDLLGYFNEFTKRYNETPLLKKMYEANQSEEIFIVILDELNLARVEYYFAEFLSLLEIPDPNARYLEVVPDTWANDPRGLKGGKIKLPENMWFVGTANNDDSTFSISDKVYDRAMTLQFDRKSPSFPPARAQKRVYFPAGRFETFVQEARERFRLADSDLSRLEKLDGYLMERFGVTFGNRVMRQIVEYVPVYMGCGGEKLEALDDILFKKVFRKLEGRACVRGEGENLTSLLDGLFGRENLGKCKEFIKSLIRSEQR